MDCFFATIIILAFWFVDDFSYAIRKLARSISGFIDAAAEEKRAGSEEENSE